MRGMIWYGVNIYAVFYSLYILILQWGWSALLLLFLGPLVAIAAPLLVWISTGDSLYILILTLGNLVMFLLVTGPIMIDEMLPKNKIVSSIRTFLIAFCTLVLLSQGFAVIGVMSSVIANEGEINALAYICSVIGGVFGAYYFVSSHEDSDFEDLISKNTLYTFSIPLVLIVLIGNTTILNVYAINSMVCLLSSVYFIQNSSFPKSLKSVNNDLD
tara:strand:- start:2863 stop:3507 length:645 start_codon:yes stop_codon:yes gene_type:complete